MTPKYASWESDRSYQLYYRDPRTRQFVPVPSLRVQTRFGQLRNGIPKLSYKGSPYKFPFKKVEP